MVTKRPRTRGGFAVAEQTGSGGLSLLVSDLSDSAEASGWLRTNGKPGTSYAIIQIKRAGISVDVETVRRARLT